ncbi:MAG: bifunctional phosphoribosyl-AMP cyclohydrolase/phosphoribosyl-ATP diphosphatase HisIE, partial [Rubrobacter sp.]|nr:bifunctional phosphoribosyl-AMP cyclohydrolase/phosphoribosyl-ATP diphosphatase HisIE [Rubrobacter sp.]
MSAPEGTLDSVRYDDNGLVPVIAQDASTGEVLMLAYANREAVEETMKIGEAHYYSRSRGELWRKGATSGNTQRVVEVRLDCDGDALLYRVEPRGPACHTGERSCFFTMLAGEEDGEATDLGRTLTRLAGTIVGRHHKMPEGSYTAKLLKRGTGYISQKVGEEAVEVVVAALEGERLAEESADLLYHLFVLL